MRDQINLFAVSENPSLLGGLEKFKLKEIGISLCSGTCNFHLPVKHLFNSSAAQLNNSVVFIDNLSVSRTAASQFLIKNKTILYDAGVKTIIYTGCDNRKYLSTLLDLNVNGILLNEETPLKNFFMHNLYHKNYSEKERLFYLNTGKKFIEVVKTVSCGYNYYDGPVLSLILKRNWSKNTIKLNKTPYEKDLIINAAIDNHVLNKIHRMFPNVEEIIHQLTAREKEVILCIADGKQNKQIARELFVSVRTVDTHKTNLMQKYGFKTANELYLFSFLFKEEVNRR